MLHLIHDRGLSVTFDMYKNFSQRFHLKSPHSFLALRNSYGVLHKGAKKTGESVLAESRSMRNWLPGTAHPFEKAAGGVGIEWPTNRGGLVGPLVTHQPSQTLGALLVVLLGDFVRINADFTAATDRVFLLDPRLEPGRHFSPPDR